MNRLYQSTWEVLEPGILEIMGHFDGDKASALKEDVRLCVASGEREMLLDCSAMTSITGDAMRTILAMALDMQAVQGKLALCNLPPQAKSLFDRCGLTQVVPVYAQQSEAILALVA